MNAAVTRRERRQQSMSTVVMEFEMLESSEKRVRPRRVFLVSILISLWHRYTPKPACSHAKGWKHIVPMIQASIA